MSILQIITVCNQSRQFFYQISVNSRFERFLVILRELMSMIDGIWSEILKQNAKQQQLCRLLYETQTLAQNITTNTKITKLQIEVGLTMLKSTYTKNMLQ